MPRYGEDTTETYVDIDVSSTLHIKSEVSIINKTQFFTCIWSICASYDYKWMQFLELPLYVRGWVRTLQGSTNQAYRKRITVYEIILI